MEELDKIKELFDQLKRDMEEQLEPKITLKFNNYDFSRN